MATNKGAKDLTKKQSEEIHDEFEPNSFNMTRFNRGIIDEMTPEEIRDMLVNPSSKANQKTLENIAMYYYLSNGDIFQQFDLTRVLPRLNYSVESLKINNKMDKFISETNKFMRKVNHKELTRDSISQLISTGTLCGIWLGEKGDLYPMIFNDLEYFFPAKRVQGKWVVWCDLSYFDNLSKLAREEMLDALDPYISMSDYENYLEDRQGYRYIELPVERGFAIRTHTLRRNQKLGFPWVTTALYDIAHKKTLKDLEKAVSNKIINAIGVMTIGTGDKPNSSIKPEIKKKVYSKAKEALEKNEDDGISLISLPEWASIEFGKFDSSPLDPKKFESINSDTANATGIARGLTNGEGSYSTSKINLDIIYNKIAELLEMIETEIYNRAINLLDDKEKDVYYIEYEKGTPLSTKEQLDTHVKLISLGYSISPLLNMLGLDSKEYVDRSIREIESWKIREKILPPLSTYTATGDDKVGNPTKEDVTNENTIISKDNSNNMNPKANV